MNKFVIMIIILMVYTMDGFSNIDPVDSIASEEMKTIIRKPWYETIQLRGYAQMRYNGFFETNPDLQCAQCDRSWGGDADGFFFRRIRLIFSGQIHERVFMYIQPDLASGGNNTAQIRDAYFDLGLDAKQEFRLRIGQSKVPFGFENLQSSQNRLPLDRHDGMNSAVLNERDLGVFFYYAPSEIRKRFNYLVNSGLKGSGDYGMFGLGLYNGQTANLPEQNRNFHVVSRATYPFELASGQIIEASFQAYTGKFVINREMKTDTDQTEFEEFRYGPTFVMYPQPFGFQAEFNWGRGPEYDPELDDVVDAPLRGGYILANYFYEAGKHLFIPFTRYHYYQGGKKFEFDATRHRVRELEIGVEWQPHRNFELVAMYTISDRTFENSLNPDNRQKGSLLRLQAQVNF
ncbi:OprO/OprP family phosphate-selective porin [Belliella sp. DSM 111904]|uniref:OprO/OprP family phosphate-selective porin n=1 Tax=Belliella filtrata TaxID=2923435 RepID=A0ABS9UVK7_9BACT|nr:porin [Belliella filtrata]MCH7408196.1 OprO/OprP family phosphate-selective porin [Belliella filtrata]